ncbi:hypothetical protein NW762_001308 [Fusarium torreyae]|uniref:Uncharacterized protein n=1 Tax=Fusarium torreyae TaxID=1237075 RepID=A0A9W8SF98_9HYPO|nr:hypothetical protein NW762_001308 [Fusarium torreyae]
MTLNRSRFTVPKTIPATASWRVPSSATGADMIGTESSADELPWLASESRALRLRSLPD